MDFKKIPLHSVHVELGAKIVPFAGFEMPVRYSSDIEEHMAVRKDVGIFDVSHMGEFTITGPESQKLIQKVTSNNVEKLIDGKAQYTCLTNEAGGIIDDLLVYRLNENSYFLVVNASNIRKDLDWINSQNNFNAVVTNVSDELCLFAIQGPKALATLQKISSEDLSKIKYYSFLVDCKINGKPGIIVSNTGYTGAGGFEIYVPNELAVGIWNVIMTSGQEFGIKPIGLGARDTLRLEMGYCLYGNDINDQTSPLEAGLGWITSFEKEFIGSDKIINQKEKGVFRKLVGFKMEERAIPRSHYEIFDSQSEKIGEVTSGTQSPILQCGIGMGYVDIDHAKIGSEIFIKIREKKCRAYVAKMPFI